nr:protein PELOTA 1 [Ipomoea batatas]
MVAEEADDLWIAYNLIAEGDTVLASTFRKVLREDASGGREAERLKLKLQIKVEAVEYDKEDSALRIRGKNILENEHVKIGAFHTLEIELHRPFVLGKDVWDSLALEALRQAAVPVYSVTISRSRIETSIPRKHGSAIAGYDKALTKFFNNVVDAFLKHIDFNVIRCAVIASPGFTKDPDRACYGPKHVEVAHERMAIQTLLITDEVFRNSDVATRQKYANLVKAVKSSGGTTHIFSSMHVSGEQLTLMSGIAAILRFPLPDLDDIEM